VPRLREYHRGLRESLGASLPRSSLTFLRRPTTHPGLARPLDQHWIGAPRTAPEARRQPAEGRRMGDCPDRGLLDRGGHLFTDQDRVLVTNRGAPVSEAWRQPAKTAGIMFSPGLHSRPRSLSSARYRPSAILLRPYCSERGADIRASSWRFCATGGSLWRSLPPLRWRCYCSGSPSEPSCTSPTRQVRQHTSLRITSRLLSGARRVHGGASPAHRPAWRCRVTRTTMLTFRPEARVPPRRPATG